LLPALFTPLSLLPVHHEASSLCHMCPLLWYSVSPWTQKQ
jgi:hypothetical protein